MNNVTENLLNGLLKLKEIKPRIYSIATEYDIFEGFMGRSKRYYNIVFCGYVGFSKPETTFSKYEYLCVYPTEIKFDITMTENNFKQIEWDTINEKMGYVVGGSLESSYLKLPKSINQKICTCDKYQVLNKGCICGGS